MKVPMNPGEVERRLLHYFATVRARAGTIFTVRDFNNVVMMDAYTPEDRACLQPALQSLERAGLLEIRSSTECCLTRQGVCEVWSRHTAPV